MHGKRWMLAAACGLGLSLMACSGNRDEDSIRISGNIEMTEVNVAFKMSGKLVERNLDEGDPVEKGAVVARLDQAQLLHQKEQAAAALAAAEANLRQFRTGIDYQREAVAGQIAQQQAQLSQARARLRELETGSRTQEVRQSEALVAEAQTEHQRASADWERAQPLFEADDISRALYDQYEARFQAATAKLEQARQRLDLVREGPRAETIEAGRAAVEQAQAALRLAAAQRLELKRREQEVATRQAEIERARAQVALIETQLDDMVAVAPVSGRVLSKAAEVGEVLAAGTTVLTIGDLDRPWLRGYINETDLGRVKLGSPARVTTDSYPGRVYPGTVTFVSSEAEFTPKQIQTREERVKLVYRVKIEIDNPNQELKLNMPADAVIAVE